jgi:hypothetical protein
MWAEEQDWFGTEDLVLNQIETEQFQLENHLWETKDGSLIEISNMNTSHIKNCIKMIYRYNGNWRHRYLRLFEKELRKRKMKKEQLTLNNIDLINECSRELKCFSYLHKPITECTNEELTNWYIAFRNGADMNDPDDQSCYQQFEEEIPNRSEEFQNTIKYIDSIL